MSRIAQIGKVEGDIGGYQPSIPGITVLRDSSVGRKALRLESDRDIGGGGIVDELVTQRAVERGRPPVEAGRRQVLALRRQIGIGHEMYLNRKAAPMEQAVWLIRGWIRFRGVVRDVASDGRGA